MDEQTQTQNEQPQDLNPDLAGYPDQASLVQGYRASGNEAKKQRERADALERELQATRQAQANPRADVKQRLGARDRLAEYGIPVDAVQELMGEMIHESFKPIAAGLNARTSIQARYPDYTKFESDVAQYLESDPEIKETYNRMFAADPVGAFEWGFLKFGDARRRGTKERGEPNTQDVVNAGIPSQRNGDSRRQPQGQQANVQEAWERFQKTGSSQDARTYAKARLRTVITDEFLNQ
jgi:hypothetical protein